MTTETAASDDSVPLCRTLSFEEKLIRVLAAVVSLTGLALGYFVNEWGYLLTLVAGLNLLQSAFTGFCPPEIIYRWRTK